MVNHDSAKNISDYLREASFQYALATEHLRQAASIFNNTEDANLVPEHFKDHVHMLNVARRDLAQTIREWEMITHARSQHR